MKSKLLVDFDFGKNEPFIQVNLHQPYESQLCSDNTLSDLADKALKSFVEQANARWLELVYPQDNKDNRSPQIRLKEQQQS